MASNLVITQLIFPINTNRYTVNGLNLVVTWQCSLIVRVSVVLRRTVVGCSDCHTSYIGETGRNLATRLTEHKRATRKGDTTFNDWPWKAGLLTWNRLPSTGVSHYWHHTKDSSTTLTLQTNQTEQPNFTNGSKPTTHNWPSPLESYSQ